MDTTHTRQSTRLMLAVLATLIMYTMLPVERVEAARTDPVGTSYPSQKIVFTDPRTGHTVWRMTVDGTQQGALNNINDSSGMEADHFSPDSKRICYIKTSSTAKPAGFYVMDIQTGVETFVAVAGDGRWGWLLR